MITISLCMIVKNEEKTLPYVLDSIKDIVDEIIIVDTGSNDHTKEIAANYTQNIFDFDWQDDFSEARNFSFSKATKEYCMWLDADDIILSEDKEKILQLKNQLDASVDIVMMKYNVAFDDENKPVFYYFRERIVRNGKGYNWQGAVHEVITPFGNLYYSDAAVTHRKIRQKDPDRI